MSGIPEPRSFEELLARTKECLEGKSRSYIADARTFAAWISNEGRQRNDDKELLARVTVCQRRCTELLEQRRALSDFIEGLLKVPPEERDSATFDAMLGSAYDASKQMR